MSKCTGWFDGWFGKSWADACQLHDDRYKFVIEQKRKEARDAINAES